VHHIAADTLHSTDKFTLVYKNLIDEKANALIMDSETINFNQYNLGILPQPGIIYAVNYLEALLGLLSKYVPCKDLRKQLKSLKLIKSEEYLPP
jgi:hypothetical protein